MIQSIDHVALLPLYAAGGAALLVLIADLVTGRHGPVVGTAALGAVLTVAAAIPTAGRAATFCTGAACSWVPTPRAATVAVLFAALTLGVLALSVPALRAGTAPTGEACFLLVSAMTGGVVIGYAGDLITTPPVIELTSRKQASPAGAVPARSAGTDSASTPSVSAAKSTATVAARGVGTQEQAAPVQNVAARPVVGTAATTVTTAPSAAVPTTGTRRPVTRSAISTSSAAPPAA